MRASARIPALTAPVQVLYDRRGVPHIFASSVEDATRALGYVVARDRLLQLDLQTHAATGRLTEMVGAAALPLDREMRSLGLPWAAERKLAAVDTATSPWRASVAYAQGVNAYIDGMSDADIPLEYRLLGVHPERWQPVNTIHLIDRMGWTLAYNDVELLRLRVASLVGDDAAAALVPQNSPIQEPIQPNGQSAPRFDRRPLPPPGSPDTASGLVAQTMSALLDADRQDVRVIAEARPAVTSPETDVALGSNNWAVAPRRTRDGAALLAGDPHLQLTLPSIWYEAHLVVPGQLDVYGVTIPGAPSIILGFNRDVAWTFTNTESDALDFYAESVDVAGHPTRYLLDGQWRPLISRIETYRGKQGEPIAVDTLLFTHRGPMRRIGGGWLSMRWTVLDPTNDIAGFTEVASTHSADEWLAAMRGYSVPAQNMLVADRSGTIAIRSTGHFPLRPGQGSGAVVRDGTRSVSDWTGFWPIERYPFARNPAQGFLASANQQPIDPLVDAGYLGAEWPSPWRAMRINTLLRRDSAVTVDDMRRFQTDAGSARADLFVPRFLDAASHAATGDTIVQHAAQLLAQWDRRYTKDNSRAILFELAMTELGRRVWDELIPPGDSVPVVTPVALVQLLDQPKSRWWDDRRTPDVVETRDDVLTASLRQAYVRALARYGTPDGDGWRWSRVRHQNIEHMLMLAPFSRRDIPMQGGPGTLNPSSGDGTEGASWRMIVQLGAEVRGWGTYPGGQSGNPFSSRYDDRLARWEAGELDSLVFPRTPGALRDSALRSALLLRPAR